MATTINTIINAMTSAKGFQFVGITYGNEVRMNKGGNPYYGRLTKVVSGQMCFNGNYENMVNNRIEREGFEGVEFVSDKLPWGQWVEGGVNKVITHKGEFYIRLYPTPNTKMKVTYYLDGVECTESEVSMILKAIAPFLPKQKESAKQSECGLEGVKQLHPQSIKLSNIREISINGVTYKM